MINRERGSAEWEMKRRAAAESIYFTWLMQESQGLCFIRERGERLGNREEERLGVSVHKLEAGGDRVRKTRQAMK